MSDPVYRIDVKHTPGDVKDWYGSVVQLSDDAYMMGSGNYGDSSDEVIRRCSEWIKVETTREDSFSVYTDENGYLSPTHPADLSLVREFAPDTEHYPTTA